MNKSDLKNFAINARLELLRRVSDRAALYGISEKAVKDKSVVPSAAFHKIDGTPLTASESERRNALIVRASQIGYRPAMEEAAYTWFNRFVALKYLQEHNLLPVAMRVLPDAPGVQPQILREAQDVSLPNVDLGEILSMLDGNRTDELYKYLLLKLCAALSETLPGMFEEISPAEELLFPDALLKADSVLGEMAKLDADCWSEIQVIGWLYQYYITDINTLVYDGSMSKSRIPKELLPAATQIFTPDWVVKYMVENSLGRLWLEGHPDENLRMKWRYFMDEAQQSPEVAARLAELRAPGASIQPEQLTVLDPCMGSGHILVYAFEVLMEIYRSVGYTDRDAAASIVENNLYGLDIDDRAAQLAYFAVMMKACEYDRRFLRRGVQPHVCAVQESAALPDETLAALGAERPLAERLLKTFVDAKEYGSLVNVDLTLAELERLDTRLAELETAAPASLLTMADSARNAAVLKPLVKQAKIMTMKYDVTVTNPPYLGSSRFSAALNEYVVKNYPDGKADLSTAMYTKAMDDFTKKEGFVSFITITSWMFLSSFEKYRARMLNRQSIVNLVDFGSELFDGKVGHNLIAAWVARNTHFHYKMTAVRLVDYNFSRRDEKQSEFFQERNRYTAQQDNFKKIPGAPIAYWVSERMISVFSKGKALCEVAQPKQGIKTADKDRFLRYWHEVNFQKTSLSLLNVNRWYPCNKGGKFRKWYGNNEYVVNWQNNGCEICNFRDETGKLLSRPQNLQYMLREGLTYTNISSSTFGVRYCPQGYVYDAAGSGIFCEDECVLNYSLAFLLSNVAAALTKITSPTMSFEVGQIAQLPLISSSDNDDDINESVHENIELSKSDWDSFEISWDFKKHPMI